MAFLTQNAHNTYDIVANIVNKIFPLSLKTYSSCTNPTAWHIQDEARSAYILNMVHQRDIENTTMKNRFSRPFMTGGQASDIESCLNSNQSMVVRRERCTTCNQHQNNIHPRTSYISRRRAYSSTYISRHSEIHPRKSSRKGENPMSRNHGNEIQPNRSSVSEILIEEEYLENCSQEECLPIVDSSTSTIFSEDKCSKREEIISNFDIISTNQKLTAAQGGKFKKEHISMSHMPERNKFPQPKREELQKHQTKEQAKMRFNEIKEDFLSVSENAIASKDSDNSFILAEKSKSPDRRLNKKEPPDNFSDLMENEFSYFHISTSQVFPDSPSPDSALASTRSDICSNPNVTARKEFKLLAEKYHQYTVDCNATMKILELKIEKLISEKHLLLRKVSQMRNDQREIIKKYRNMFDTAMREHFDEINTLVKQYQCVRESYMELVCNRAPGIEQRDYSEVQIFCSYSQISRGTHS